MKPRAPSLPPPSALARRRHRLRLLCLPFLRRLRAPQKENFLESLDKRRALISDDIKADQHSLGVLRAHVAALGARVKRLQKQRLALELGAQAAQYTAAHKKLESESAGIEEVARALTVRRKSVESETRPLFDAEVSGLAASLDASLPAGYHHHWPAQEERALKGAPPAAAAAGLLAAAKGAAPKA